MADVKEDKHTCLIQEHGSVAGRAAGVAKVERGEDLLAPDDHNEAEDNGNTQHEPVVSAGLVAQQLWRGKEGSKVTKMDLVKGDVNAKAKASNKTMLNLLRTKGLSSNLPLSRLTTMTTSVLQMDIKQLLKTNAIQ